jgi:hypothetical protein
VRLNRKLSDRTRFPIRRAGLGTVVTLAALVSVALVTPTTSADAASTQVALRGPLAPAAGPDPLAAAVAAAAGPPGPAQVGVAVLDRTTGRLTLGRLGTVPFLSASVVKLVTAVDVLRRAEIGQGTVSPAQRALIRRALTASDDTAMNALWQQFGGPRTVTELAGWAHLRDTRAPAPTAQWAETKLSARDVVATYAYVFKALNPVDRKLVLDSLRAATPAGADGFDQSFGLLSAPRRPGVAAKQGWMTAGPAEYLHSTGLIGPGDRYVVVVLSKRPAADGFPGGRAAVTAAVARVVSALALTPPAAKPSPPPAARPGAHPPVARPPARPAPRHVPYPQLRTTARP